jgi:hypothetical protein
VRHGFLRPADVDVERDEAFARVGRVVPLDQELAGLDLHLRQGEPARHAGPQLPKLEVVRSIGQRRANEEEGLAHATLLEIGLEEPAADLLGAGERAMRAQQPAHAGARTGLGAIRPDQDEEGIGVGLVVGVLEPGQRADGQLVGTVGALLVLGTPAGERREEFLRRRADGAVPLELVEQRQQGLAPEALAHAAVQLVAQLAGASALRAQHVRLGVRCRRRSVRVFGKLRDEDRRRALEDRLARELLHPRAEPLERGARVAGAAGLGDRLGDVAHHDDALAGVPVDRDLFAARRADAREQDDGPGACQGEDEEPPPRESHGSIAVGCDPCPADRGRGSLRTTPTDRGAQRHPPRSIRIPNPIPNEERSLTCRPFPVPA